MDVVAFFHRNMNRSWGENHGCYSMPAGVWLIQRATVMVTYPGRSSWAPLTLLKPKRYPGVRLDRKSRNSISLNTSLSL
jgi:hypothetical protein